jgi:hypothetical protein
MKYILIALIKVYQRNKPKKWIGCCIYEPSCSNYAISALKKYGFFDGSILAYKRIMRCDHKHVGGVDLP